MSSSDRIVSNKVLWELTAEGIQVGKKMQSISGTFGERVKNAVETKHLHAGAFAQVNRLNKMDEAKRNDYLASLEIYIEKMREGPWKAGHVGDFVAQAEAAERKEAEDAKVAARTKEVDDSVARIETGISGVKDPADPEKVTTIADARAKKAAKEKERRDRIKAEKAEEAAPGSVAEKADRAEAAHNKKVAGVEASDATDEAGNKRPRDIGGDDWDRSAKDLVGKKGGHDGMPGAEPTGPIH